MILKHMSSKESKLSLNVPPKSPSHLYTVYMQDAIAAVLMGVVQPSLFFVSHYV